MTEIRSGAFADALYQLRTTLLSCVKRGVSASKLIARCDNEVCKAIEKYADEDKDEELKMLGIWDSIKFEVESEVKQCEIELIRRNAVATIYSINETISTAKFL